MPYNDMTAGSTLTGFFDTRGDAEDAVARLRDAGIADADIRLIAGADNDAVGTTVDRDQDKGFFEKMTDFFFPDEDRYAYAEGLRRGGFLVTVTGLHGDLYDTALDILDDEGSVDLAEREETWRAEGWTGYQPDAVTAGRIAETGGTLGDTANRVGTQTSLGQVSTGASLTGASVTSATAQGGVAASSATFDRTGRAADEEVIPLAEEHLRVGKRDVSHGRVRVRTYVVETPVNEEVHLHREHVHVDRRPVDRPVGAADDLFQDRIIEAEEHAEEAVISKEARIREEVALRREQADETKSISDSVRRTEVEIEDERLDRDRTARGNRRA